MITGNFSHALYEKTPLEHYSLNEDLKLQE